MSNHRQWLHDKRGKAVVKVLREKGFEADYVGTKEEALLWLLDHIKQSDVVSWGGSVTLAQIGIFTALRGRNQATLPPTPEGLDVSDPKAVRLARRKTLDADVFLTGVNAITLGGNLVNIDGTGNRVAATLFGPETVIFVAGVNKITDDDAAAIYRVKNEATPMNGLRLGRKTPCAATGFCADCNSPDRMCRGVVIHERPMAMTRMLVLLVGEELGF
jgi:hypothetical protein